jgi:hypothetical protein
VFGSVKSEERVIGTIAFIDFTLPSPLLLRMMLSRRNLLIIGWSCFLVASSLFFLSVRLQWIGKPWGIWIAWVFAGFLFLAMLCFVWEFMRDMPGWGKLRGLGILALAMLPLLYLVWVSKDPTKGIELLPHASFLVAAIAAIIAAFSGMAATKSAESASKSLELARTTTRPFLNIVEPTRCGIYYSTIGMVAAKITNKGVFPADNVCANCLVYHDRERSQKHRLKLQETKPAILFPDQQAEEYIFVPDENEDSALIANLDDQIIFQITIEYRNKLTGKEHKTIRVYTVRFNPTAISAPTPLSNLDYWD